MLLKFFKPTTPSNRGRLITLRSKLWKKNSINKLTIGLSKKSGRNNLGRITVFTKGGGHKQNYRKIDFKRSIINIPAIINLNKSYIKSKIINIENNIIIIDAGLKSNILITKNEYLKSLKQKSLIFNKYNNNNLIGNTIKFYFYQIESILNDSVIDYKSYNNKIIKKEYKIYKNYLLPMIICQKIINNEKILKAIKLPKRKNRKHKKLKQSIGFAGLKFKLKIKNYKKLNNNLKKKIDKNKSFNKNNRLIIKNINLKN